MSRFRRRLLMMMQKVQEIWRDVVLTGTGVIVATDTTEGQQAKIFPQGWTKQNQYEGKNLFDVSKYVSDIQSVNNGDGSITLIEYVPNRTNKVKDAMPMLNVGDIVYVSAVNLKYVYFDIIYVVNKPITITEEILNGNFGFYGNNSGESITISDIMISKTKDLPYEPYTGGQPSPSPEYPQPITNAGTYNEETGKYEYGLKIAGKNLFDREYFKIAENWINQETSYPSIPIFVGKGRTITVSTSGNPEGGLGFYCTISKQAEKPTTSVYTWICHSTSTDLINRKVTFTVTEGDYIYFALSLGVRNIEKFLSAFPDFQIEYGEERTEYQEYKEQTVTITSDRPLTQWDRLVYMDGQWQWEYNSKEIVLDGSDDEVWGLYTPKEGFSLFFVGMKSGARNDGWCDKLQNQKNISNTKGVIFGLSNANIYFVYVNDYAETVKEWKEWLKTNNLKILFERDTPEYIPLQESEQQELNYLKTYYPTTVFSNNQEGFMQVEYRTKYGGDA